MLAVIICGIAAPATVHAAPATSLPASFKTYPLSDPNAQPNDFQLGPDGQWWLPPLSSSTIDRVTTAGIDNPVQLGSPALAATIASGADGNLWMTDFNVGSNGGFDKISPTGTLLATYPAPDSPFFPVLGPDGNVWYCCNFGHIGRITPTGAYSSIQWPGEYPGHMINGPGGDVWALADNEQFPGLQAAIGSITPGGAITTFPVPASPAPLGSNGEPNALTAGSDGDIWYADALDGVIGRVTPSGVVTQFVTPDAIEPFDIAAGPDGNLWFIGLVGGSTLSPVVGRFTTSGQIGVFDVSQAGSPFAIRSGPDGRIWLAVTGPASVAAFQPFTPPPSRPDIRDISTRYSLPSGGGQVVVTGYDVGAATQVFFGSTPATSFSILGPSQVVATVPPHAVGAVDVTVATPYGTSMTSAPTLTTTGSHFYYQATNCGTVVSQSMQLSGDIGPCYSAGLTVASDNVTLDLNGHGVVGFQDPRDGSVVGIDLQQRSRVTIANGTVSGFDAGIHIAGGAGNTVAHMNIHDNIGPDNVFTSQFGDGIMIEHSSSNRIVHNVINHNGVFDGIGIFGLGSDGTIIANNTVENTLGTSDHGPVGEGIIINGASGSGPPTAIHSTVVEHNVVSNNASSGIANINEISGTIEFNTVTGSGATNSYGNGIGVQVGRNWTLGPTQMVIAHNLVTGNGVDGIRLGTARAPFNGAPGGNTVTDNQSTNNATNLAADIYESGIQGYDLHDIAANCGTDLWSKNQWGSAGFTPVCTSAGGSGPGASSPAGTSPPQESVPKTASPATGFPNAQQWETFLQQGRQ